MRRILATLAVAAAIVLAVPAPANAGVQTVGWFTRNPAASAPEGGVQVANAPDGMVSFGAIAVFEETDSITKATLTLKETGQNLNAAAAKLQACPAAGTFKGGKGTFADGPKADCLVGKVELVRDPTGTWTGEVTSVLRGDPAAIAVVPADGAGVFQLGFAPPEIAVEADAGGSGLESSFDASEFGGSGDSGASGSSSSFSNSESGSGSTSGGSSFDSSFGSSFSSSSASPSTFDASSAAITTGGGLAADPGAPTATAVAPTDASAPAEVAGGTNLPTRRNLTPAAAASTRNGNAGVQFLFFALTAAVIGTGAGFARNRLVTVKG